MPADRPELDAAAARAVAAEAFSPCGTALWGLEAERIVYRREDLAARVPYSELCPLAGLMPGSGRVTLEPGGQVEISTAPAPDLDTALDALAADTAELDIRLRGMGLWAADLPVDAERPPRRILALPRYQAMEAYFDAAGGAGRWMMCNTAALQVNLSHDPADPGRRWQVMHAIAPLLVATFASSPGLDSAGRPWASLRQGIWQALDPGRTRAPRRAGRPEQAWADYVLAADVMLIRRPDQALPVRPGMPFAHWLHAGHPAGWPTVDDLRYHMSTLFPPIRPRGWLEIRVLDALPAAVREVAVLTVAAAARAEIAGELLARLPDTGAWWLPAARLGLADDQLAAAAALLFEITAKAMPLVTSRPERIAAVAEYRGNHVARRLQPWGGNIGHTRLGRTLVPQLDSRPLASVA